jgi:hypothetical protein
MARVAYSFTLDTEVDRRIIRWLDSLPRGEKSAAIRDALQANLGGGLVTLGDILQAVRELERKLQPGVVVAQAPTSQTEDIPPDVAANLDKLGL